MIFKMIELPTYVIIMMSKPHYVLLEIHTFEYQ